MSSPPARFLRSSLRRVAAVLSRRAPDPRASAGDPHEGLSARLQALDGTVREGTVRGLAMLWKDFLELSGGPQAFREGGELARREHLDRLEMLRERMERDPAQRPYAIALAAMAAYLEILCRDKIGKTESELAATVAALIDQGHRPRPREPSLPASAAVKRRQG
jgi:hypothetical protein